MRDLRLIFGLTAYWFFFGLLLGGPILWPDIVRALYLAGIVGSIGFMNGLLIDAIEEAGYKPGPLLGLMTFAIPFLLGICGVGWGIVRLTSN